MLMELNHIRMGRNKGSSVSEGRTTRRSFVQSIAASTALFAGTGVSSASAEPTNRGPDEETFRVKGTQIIRRKVQPKAVEIKITKKSPDLKERYGKGTLQKTLERERPNPEKDDLPKQAPTEVEKREWNAYIATKDEWVALQNAESEPDNGVSTDRARYPSSLPKYYHENVDGLWERRGPINVLSYETEFSDANDLAGAIAARGGTWTTYVIEYKRHALIDGSYKVHDASAATSPDGTFGRQHVRLWTAGDYVIGGAHVDSNAPHSVTSYIEAEYELQNVVGGWRDHYRAYNDKGDHNGLVTRLSD